MPSYWSALETARQRPILRLSGSLSGIRRARRVAALTPGCDGNPSALPGLLGDEDFDVWLEGRLVFSDDRRSGVGGDGTGFAADLGASYRVSERVLIGAKLRYRGSDAERDDGSVKTDSKGIGLAAWADILLPGGAILTPMAAYQKNDADLTLSDGTSSVDGSFDVDIATLGARLSRRFTLAGGSSDTLFYIEPNTSLSYVFADRDTYQRSDGVQVPGADIDQGRLTFGPRFGVILGAGDDDDEQRDPAVRSEGDDDGTVWLLSIGADGVWNFDPADEFGTINSRLVETPEFYGAVSANIGAVFEGGVNGSISIRYSGIGADVGYTGVYGVLIIPLD